MSTSIPLPNNLPTPELSTDYCYEISKWVFDNYDREDIILATVHGSYLYGTAHENSDLDFYVVVEGGKPLKKIFTTPNGYTIDVSQKPVENFIHLLHEGTHEALEALYSPYAVWDEESFWAAHVKSQRVNLASFAKKHLSTADSFREFAKNRPEKAEKFLAHAQRLEHNVEQAYDNNGYYNPVWKALS